MSRFIVSPHAQGTIEWKQDRAGKATGSSIAAIFAKVAKGEAAARVDYRMQLVLERLTGCIEEIYINKEMQWGTDCEPAARLAYEADSGLIVNEAGFCYLPDLMAGCSVDGFIESTDGRTGVFETKSPKSKTHLAYVDSGEIPSIYRPQVIHNLWITGATFADFQSYDPRFPAGLQRMVVRLERDAKVEEEITAHAAAVKVFLGEVDQLEKQLRLRAA